MRGFDGEIGAVDLLHIAYGGLGGHRTDVNGLNSELSLLGIRTAVIGVTQSADHQTPASTWLHTRYLPQYPSHPLGFFRRWPLKKVLAELRPRIVLAHSHGLVPEVMLWCRLHKTSSRLILRECHASRLRSRKDNLRSQVSLQLAEGVIFVDECQYADYPLAIRRTKGTPLVALIPNGIAPIRALISQRPVEPSGTLTAGMAARLVPGKRVDLLIRVAAELRRKGVPIRVIIAGDGPDRSKFEDLAAQLLDPADIEFWGEVSQDQMSEFYQSLSLYVHLTDGEGSSNALLEAASHGLPIVVSEYGGMRANGEQSAGALHVRNSVSDISAAVGSVLGNSDLLRELGNLNREFIKSQRSLEDMASAYVDLFAMVDPGGPWSDARRRFARYPESRLQLIE